MRPQRCARGGFEFSALPLALPMTAPLRRGGASNAPTEHDRCSSGGVMAVLALPLEPEHAARVARLRHVDPEAMPGLRRVRAGAGFAYADARGRRVRDPGTLQRIRRIAIPPAWTSVWICPLANGHIQAVGRDARGRKQYRYHERWREVRDATKFHKIIAFGGGAAAHPRCGRAGPSPSRTAARQGARDGRASARGDANSRRERGVCARERVLRVDDAAQRARADAGRPRSPSGSEARGASRTRSGCATRASLAS